MLTKNELLNMSKKDLIKLGEDCEGLKDLSRCQNCRDCYRCQDCENCQDCWNCYRCQNCLGCQDCENCIGLKYQKNQTNVAFGIPCSKEEIATLKKKMK